ncbi:MAG: efflux RND transporter periplasmic adaptor subunit [Gemmatimonadota bacterium]
MNRTFLVLLATAAIAACAKKEEQQLSIQTVPVDRRTIVVDATASGAVEPINVVEVKSKSSGQITKMTVETGSQVKPGDLLVQLDTRDVQNQYDQAAADRNAADAKLQVSEAQRKRAEDLFKQRIITAQENETAQLDFANSQAQMIRARTSLDLAKQRLEDATVRAPVTGTIIEKTVSLGQVITSATSAFGGGTTLLKMADLTQVRMRALFNETDIGTVRAGQQATVTVDAYPDRPFRGTVEKIEPQAVVDQSVTMFPVLINLSNRDGLLKPGMNGEASVLVERRENVLAVTNDAVRTTREAPMLAGALGLDPDSVGAQIATQMAALGGGGRPGAGGDAGLNIAGPPREMRRMMRGEVALSPSPQSTDGARAGQQGRARPAPGDTSARPPRGGAAGRGAPGAAGAPAEQGGNAAARQAQGGAAVPRPEGEFPMRTRTRSGVVYLKVNDRFEPRVVRLGLGNFDYTEVVSGLTEGDQVALLGAAAIQASRDSSNARFRQMTGGGMPGMQKQPSTTQGSASTPAGRGTTPPPRP